MIRKITRGEVESLRGELFHMILFAMAWVLIGEYSVDFRDYAAGVIITLIVVVWLALYSIRLYDLEDALEEKVKSLPCLDAKERKHDRMYALILVFEGIAILITWSILLKQGHDNWVIAAFALIAGLHFIPLARVIRLTSYYFLGAWISLLAVFGYWLFNSGRLEDVYANLFIAYGCAAGAAIDAFTILFRMRRMLR